MADNQPRGEADLSKKKDDKSTNPDMVPTESNTNPKIKKARDILDQIKFDETITSRTLLKKIDTLLAFTKKHSQIKELFYLLIEGIIESSKKFNDEWDVKFLIDLLDKLITYIDSYKEDLDYLMAIEDAILQILDIFVSYEFYDLIEEYAIILINKSITNPDNIIIRTIASEATIIAIKGFGEDWNYEKTKEFDILLKGLLPPNEVDSFLASILIKGFAAEIDCYGDMHEINSLKRTLIVMRQLYNDQFEYDDEFLIYYSKALASALNWLGTYEEYDEMMITLNELSRFVSEHSLTREIRINYITGLRNALDYLGVIGDLESAEKITKELLNLADELSENRDVQSLVIMGILKTAMWAGIYWDAKLINTMLQSVNVVLNRFPEDIQLKILISRGLFNITQEISNTSNLKLMKTILVNLESLYQQNKSQIEIARIYTKAIINLIYMLSEFTDDFDTITDYLKKSEDVLSKFNDDEILIVNHTRSLVNSIRAYGLNGKIDEMEELLEVLIDFYETSNDDEITIRLGKAYIVVIKIYGDIGDLDKITQIYMILKEWVDEDSYNVDYQIIMAKSLVNIISAFGKNKRLYEMNAYMDELREISILYPSLKIIQLQVSKGLTQSIRWHVAANDLNRAISMLFELRSICDNYLNEELIQEMLSRSTRRVIYLAHRENKKDLVEELLDSLRKLLVKIPNNETIQIELARALTEILLQKSSESESDYWQSLALELEGLKIQYPDNMKLSAIHKTIAPLIK